MSTSSGQTHLYIDDGYYWHLYPYFESAKLPSNSELIDLYGDNEISGYELDRLQKRLEDARMDAQWRPDEWPVTVGWKGAKVTKEAEIQSIIKKSDLIFTLDRFLDLISYVRDNDLKLCVSGDYVD